MLLLYSENESERRMFVVSRRARVVYNQQRVAADRRCMYEYPIKSLFKRDFFPSATHDATASHYTAATILALGLRPTIDDLIRSADHRS